MGWFDRFHRPSDAETAAIQADGGDLAAETGLGPEVTEPAAPALGHVATEGYGDRSLPTDFRIIRMSDEMHGHPDVDGDLTRDNSFGGDM